MWGGSRTTRALRVGSGPPFRLGPSHFQTPGNYRGMSADRLSLLWLLVRRVVALSFFLIRQKSTSVLIDGLGTMVGGIEANCLHGTVSGVRGRG